MPTRSAEAVIVEYSISVSELFSDTEARKNSTEQHVGADGTGNFPQRLLTQTQIFRQQFARVVRSQFMLTVDQ